MVGQYPHGIDLHVRNLRWAEAADHHYIITVPETIREFKLVSDDKVTYVPFVTTDKVFINFWGRFPEIVKDLGIHPEWFLFMEQDIWFVKKPCYVPSPKEIVSFLPPQWNYHAVVIDGVRHPRVWEGGMLIHSDVVRGAMDAGICFSSYVKTLFCRDLVEAGRVSLNKLIAHDTFDEFGLYCHLVQRLSVTEEKCCVHLQGPESIHRKFPSVYYACSEDELDEVKKVVPYMDVYSAVASYFIDGHWRGQLDWNKITHQIDYRRLLGNGHHWMTKDEYARLLAVTEAFVPPRSSGG